MLKLFHQCSDRARIAASERELQMLSWSAMRHVSEAMAALQAGDADLAREHIQRAQDKMIGDHA